jgi:hypothetical protein
MLTNEIFMLLFGLSSLLTGAALAGLGLAFFYDLPTEEDDGNCYEKK